MAAAALDPLRPDRPKVTKGAQKHPPVIDFCQIPESNLRINLDTTDLYDCFYTPPELPTQKQEIEECHRALIEALGKPERRLVLKIIDAKDHISEDTSLDSFISGFRLAWRLSAELNHYDDERPARCQAAEKPGARFTLKKEDDEQ